jgi:hypothetical protein
MKYTKSLGKLRPATKTKDQSPDMTGRIFILPETLATLVRDLQEGGSDGVEANIAAWVNIDSQGRYLGIEISPLFVKKKRAAAAAFIQDLLGEDGEAATSPGVQSRINPASDRATP